MRRRRPARERARAAVIVLAIDGALGGFSTAVAHDEAIVARVHHEGNVALELGLSSVSQAMHNAGITAARIDRIAVGIGPGTFTGLRIAVTYAKALAQAWERPLVAASSFDALEYGTAFDTVLSVVAGRPGVISVRFRRNADVERASGKIDDVIERLLSKLPQRLPVMGRAQDVLAALSERGIVAQSVPSKFPPSAAIALLAGTLPPSGIHAVVADYGELPPARPPARVRR